MEFIAEDALIGLAQYTHADDIDMYTCCQDIDTQKGYNGKFDQTFDEFRKLRSNGLSSGLQLPINGSIKK